MGGDRPNIFESDAVVCSIGVVMRGSAYFSEVRWRGWVRSSGAIRFVYSGNPRL